jgi:hypothetical protein
MKHWGTPSCTYPYTIFPPRGEGSYSMPDICSFRWLSLQIITLTVMEIFKLLICHVKVPVRNQKMSHLTLVLGTLSLWSTTIYIPRKNIITDVTWGLTWLLFPTSKHTSPRIWNTWLAWHVWICHSFLKWRFLCSLNGLIAPTQHLSIMLSMEPKMIIIFSTFSSIFCKHVSLSFILGITLSYVPCHSKMDVGLDK